MFVHRCVLKLDPLDLKFERFMIPDIGYFRVTRRFKQCITHREYPALAILYLLQVVLFKW